MKPSKVLMVVVEAVMSTALDLASDFRGQTHDSQISTFSLARGKMSNSERHPSEKLQCRPCFLDEIVKTKFLSLI
ncbi:hypothetical protein SUGI_0414890 [Cryptomeria japonica]|nr:hypothetical protein SUGI_0414890 [Cryptomeria japonica]